VGIETLLDRMPRELVDQLPNLGVLFILLLICARQLWIWNLMKRHGMVVTAVVGRVRPSKGGWLRVSYSFSVDADKRLTGEGAWPEWWLGAVDEGQAIGIRYYSRNPRLSRVDHRGFRDWGVWWSFGRPPHGTQ
jgi:hypothetical protein